MRTEYRSYEENSGKLTELFVFGRVKIDNPDYLKGLKKCEAKMKPERSSCFLELIKEFQPFDPANPQKKVMRDILGYFRQNAGFKDEKEKEKVKIFTALDSVVDRELGVDMFIMAPSKGDDYVYVKGDGTVNKEKSYDRYSKEEAEVVFDIGSLPDPSEHPQEYAEEVQKIGQEFVKQYRARQTK